jgi:hypothetical protein
MNLFSSQSRPDRLWDTTSPLFSEYCGLSFMGINWLEREADHSAALNAEVKNT